VPTVDWNDRGNAEVWRHAWEVMQNKYLEAAGIDARISMMSYERQGIVILIERTLSKEDITCQIREL